MRILVYASYDYSIINTATKISLVNSYTAAITTSVIILFGIMVLLGLAIAYFIKLKHLTCAERYTGNREQLKTAMIVAVPRYIYINV